jgi:hypothetical protein
MQQSRDGARGASCSLLAKDPSETAARSPFISHAQMPFNASIVDRRIGATPGEINELYWSQQLRAAPRRGCIELCVCCFREVMALLTACRDGVGTLQHAMASVPLASCTQARLYWTMSVLLR